MRESNPESPDRTTAYIPALRWHALTPAYDLVVRVTSGERRLKQRLLDHARLAIDDRILDVGCGTGTLLAAAAARAPGLELYGVDRDPVMLRRATVGANSAHLCLADARALPIDAASIDVVVSSLFFHHLRDDAKDAVLAEITRVLTPGGRLRIADWGAPRSPFSRAGATVVRAVDGAAPTQTNFAGGLPALIASAGFTDVDTVERIGVPLGVVDIISAASPSAP